MAQAEAPEADAQARATTGMENLITLMEQYRALAEARGFSRWAAEALTVRYHDNVCNAIDRAAAATVERQLRLERAGA